MKQIVVFAILLLALVLILTVPASAEETIPDDGYDGCQKVYRVHQCDGCDPFALIAEPDERFCELIVYVEQPGMVNPYTKTTPGQICYSNIFGSTCLVFYDRLVRAWTEGANPYPIGLISVKSERRYAAYMPLIHRNPTRRR